MNAIAHQISLFPPLQEAQKAPALERNRPCGMSRSVAQAWARARTPAVEKDILDALAAHKGEWLWSSDIWAVSDKHQIGCWFGHALWCMARAGLIREQIVYYGKGIGAEKPGSPNYQGFGHQYSTLD